MLKLPSKIPQGSIMVEAIAAMSILLLVMVASTPPIATAIVTRIQARRVGQSIQIAQQEIDKVREMISTGYSLGTTTSYTLANLPPVASGGVRTNLSTIGAPASICTTNSSDYCPTATEGRIVNLNEQQFLVQTFISNPLLYSSVVTGATSQPVAFRVGVRVYSSTAIARLKAGGTLSNTQLNSSIGLSSNEGPQGQAPLVVLYADFVRGDLSASQAVYQTFLTNTNY